MINTNFDSEGTRLKLQTMADDPALITKPVFRADTAKYPSNEISFVEYHLFCMQHDKITAAEHYLSNLRMRIRIR